MKGVLNEIQKAMHDTADRVEARNVDDAIEEVDDEIRLEYEQDRARKMMEEIDEQDQIVRKREAKKEEERSIG